MKAAVKTLFVCSVASVFAVCLFSNASAQEKMKMEDYKIELQNWTQKETTAKNDITQCDTEIGALKSQIAETDGQIKDTWSQIYSTIGVSEQDVNAYRQKLNGLERDLNALAALSPEELFKRRKEIDDIEGQLDAMKQDRIYALSEMRTKVASLEGKIAQLRAKMPKGMYDEYTVNHGDYLWRIAGKSDIYDDPFQWVRIYSFNKDQIKDPDLIYPDQIFKVQREGGPNEYLVGKGDNLSKIAGSMDVLGDPTKWREVYEANKDVIGDEPGLIYPYQVLKLPGN